MTQARVLQSEADDLWLLIVRGASRTLFDGDNVKLTLTHWTSAVTNVLVTYSSAKAKE